MNLLVALYLLLLDDKSTITVMIKMEDPVFTITDASYHNSTIAALDGDSCSIVLVDTQQKSSRSHKKKGQGPGEFNMPRAIALSKDRVYVGDLAVVHVFDKNLKYISRFKVPNNPSDLFVDRDTLYISLLAYPLGKHSVFSYSMDGKKIKNLYEHGLKISLADPFMCRGEDGQILIQRLIDFRIESFHESNRSARPLPIAQPKAYRSFVDPDPLLKKFGPTRATYLKWRSQWTQSSCIAYVDKKIILCYQELATDLITHSWYINIYDTVKKKTLVSWKRMKGRLVCGGDLAYFAEELPTADKSETDLFLVGYRIAELCR